MPAESNPSARRIGTLDISNLTKEDIDKLDHKVLRDAIKSVIRSGDERLMHQDHLSHGNNPT
jgi:hypothetical protein